MEWVTTASREEHEECRRMSREQDMSIVSVILLLSSGPSVDDLTETQHAKALEYLSLRLGVRDREEIVRVICHRTPDHLTTLINQCVTAYTPMIRQVHQAVNLSDTMWDFERFVSDMLKMSKPAPDKKGGEARVPTVEDYVDLLHRHQQSTHKFLHQIARNGKEVVTWWRDYLHKAVSQFRKDGAQPTSSTESSTSKNNNNIRQSLASIFASLPPTEQSEIRTELNSHATYLSNLHAASAARITSVIDRTHSTPYGPGAYLARWQNLLDTTLITPAKADGPVRRGANRGVKAEGRKDVEGNEAGFMAQGEVEKVVDEGIPEAPAVERTLEVFGARFREILGGG